MLLQQITIIMIGIINENTMDLLTDVQLVTAMRHETNTVNKR